MRLWFKPINLIVTKNPKFCYCMKNPYDLSATPCGSRSGPAISVAENLVAVALGTEIDGSILYLASFNSAAGIKPNVGLTSWAGVIPISLRQDTTGYVILHFSFWDYRSTWSFHEKWLKYKILSINFKITYTSPCKVIHISMVHFPF